jgi:phospholipase/carboxylesterase
VQIGPIWPLYLCVLLCCQSAPGRLEAKETLGYVEFTTAGASTNAQLPMIIAVHGLGDSPENFSRFLRAFPAPARVIAVRAPTPYHRGFSWFDIRASSRSDRRRLRAGVKKATDQLAVTIRALSGEKPTIGRPIILGFSQGGILSFSLAARFPELISAAVPLAGLLVETKALPTKEPSKVFAFHGEKDTRIPVTGSEEAIRALEVAGHIAKLKRYPGLGHRLSPRLIQDVFDVLATELPRPASPD